MRYKSFYIKNYKGIKELRLSLTHEPKTNIITLVGLNESGKTTILEAISVFSKEPEASEIHKLIPKSRKFSFTDTIEIHACLELDEEDEEQIKNFCHSQGFKTVEPIKEFTQKVIYEFRNSEYLVTDSGWEYEFNLYGLKRKKQYNRAFSSDTPEFEAIQNFISDKLIPPIIYYPNFLFDFPSRIYLEVSASEDKEQATYRAVLNDIMDTFNEGLTIEEHIIKRLKNLLAV